MWLFRGLSKRAAIVVVALWIPAVVFGINVLWKYSATPGTPAEPPLSWPGRAPIERSAERSTLVMFAHPHCQCTSAGLGELALILAHAQGKLDAYVYFYRPAAEADDWAQTSLWHTAKSIPGVRVFEDPGAAIAKSFGVFTSGQTLLYSSGGQLQFKGGITAFRGHSGDNVGRSAIAALLRGETMTVPVVTPVFGCSLRGEL